jgi:hypothetical protein
MSETIEQGTPAPEPEPNAAPSPQESTAGQTAETTEATEQDDDGERQTKRDRRFAELSARLTAAQRDRDRQAAELEFYRRQVAQQPPENDTPEQARAREREQVRAEVEGQIRAETFHQAGALQYPDWKKRCDDLVAMGADGNFASLLVEMPGGEGVKVAAALADDPDAVQRIAQLRTERARAVALGKYAATLDDGPAPARGNGNAPSQPVVTRAPAPVRPVTGRASPTFNEYTADAGTLADRYMKQILDQQQRR